jgi:predicted nuclease of predicted toxin-antitoxin system
VTALGLASSADRTIWDYAKTQGLTIVTKDQDYHWFSVLYGPPPKVIWIRRGNCSTPEVIEILSARAVAIASFLTDGEAAFLALA